jgi:hypothetical protein
MLETQCEEEEGSKIVELRSHLEADESQRMLEISASENVKKELDESTCKKGQGAPKRDANTFGKLK